MRATYFGVDRRAGSLASGLPVFNARRRVEELTVGALGTYALTGDLLHGFKLVGGGTYTRLLNDFGRQPVVAIAGVASQWLGGSGSPTPSDLPLRPLRDRPKFNYLRAVLHLIVSYVVSS